MIFSKLCGALTGKSSQPATMLRQELERWKPMLQDFAKGFNLKLRKSKDYVLLAQVLLEGMSQDGALSGIDDATAGLLAAGIAFYKGGDYERAIRSWIVIKDGNDVSFYDTSLQFATEYLALALGIA